MKNAIALILLALGLATMPAVAQYGYPGAPSYPGADASVPDSNASYPGMAPGVPPPTLGSDPAYYGAPQTPPDGGSGRQSALMNAFNSAPTGIGDSLLTYSYVEAGYRYIDPRGNALDGNHGLGIGLSLALFQPFFLKAGFNWGSGSGGNSVSAARDADYEFSTITVGGGAYMPITDKLHFVGEIGFLYANLDADRLGISYTDGGVFVRPSLRYQAFDNLELQAGVSVSSADDYDSKVVDFGAYFRVLPKLDLNAGADFGDENRTMKLGARLRW